jgi:hypothetical protein
MLADMTYNLFAGLCLFTVGYAVVKLIGIAIQRLSGEEQ